MSYIMSEDTRDRLTKSQEEVLEMAKRWVLCPHCGFKAMSVYADACGHFSIKCSRCKKISDLNLKYFRLGKKRLCGIR